MHISTNPEHPEEHRDPLSNEPGSHPVGTGVGAASTGLIGAVGGTLIAGPVGGLIGAIVGGIAGASAGHDIAEGVHPTHASSEES